VLHFVNVRVPPLYSNVIFLRCQYFWKSHLQLLVKKCETTESKNDVKIKCGYHILEMEFIIIIVIMLCLCLQMTASKDFVVHMVATPALSSEDGRDVEMPCKQWLSVDAVDEQYITNHARQVAPCNMQDFMKSKNFCQC